MRRVSCGAVSASCQECLMKCDNALWNLLGKRQGKKNLLRNALMYQFRVILKPKPLIVVRITYQRAALAAQLCEQR